MPFGSQNKLTIGTNFRYWRNSFSSSSSLVKVHRSLESRHGTRTCTGSNARSFGSWLYWAGLLVGVCGDHAGGFSMIRGTVAVEPRRFELLTFSLQRRRSTS
jgi:hypothetical protein